MGNGEKPPARAGGCRRAADPAVGGFRRCLLALGTRGCSGRGGSDRRQGPSPDPCPQTPGQRGWERPPRGSPRLAQPSAAPPPFSAPGCHLPVAPQCHGAPLALEFWPCQARSPPTRGPPHLHPIPTPLRDAPGAPGWAVPGPDPPPAHLPVAKPQLPSLGGGPLAVTPAPPQPRAVPVPPPYPHRASLPPCIPLRQGWGGDAPTGRGGGAVDFFRGVADNEAAASPGVPPELRARGGGGAQRGPGPPGRVEGGSREAAGRTTGPGMPGRAPHLPGERLLFAAGPRERWARAPRPPPRREQRARSGECAPRPAPRSPGCSPRYLPGTPRYPLGTPQPPGSPGTPAPRRGAPSCGALGRTGRIAPSAWFPPFYPPLLSPFFPGTPSPGTSWHPEPPPGPTGAPRAVPGCAGPRFPPSPPNNSLFLSPSPQPRFHTAAPAH